MKPATKDSRNNSQRERLLAFYTGEDIVLTAEEEQIKTRLNFARTKIYDWSLNTEEIVKEIIDAFGVSKYRAEKDVADANYIFGKSFVIDKNLIAGQVVERIKQDIVIIREANRFDLLPKMYEALIKACKELPNQDNKKNKIPKVVLYSIHGNAAINAPLSATDVMQQARNQFRNDYQDIAHEEVTNE